MGDKIKRNFNVDYHFDWLYGIEISKIREDLDKLEKLGATSIEIEVGEYYDSPSISIQAISNRLETDEEYSARKKREEDYLSKIKQQELRQLEILSAKYGKK